MVYFAPSQSGKDAILEDENVFSSKKNTFSSSYFPIVPDFLPKRPHNEGGTDFLKKLYHIIRIRQQNYYL